MNWIATLKIQYMKYINQINFKATFYSLFLGFLLEAAKNDYFNSGLIPDYFSDDSIYGVMCKLDVEHTF